MSQTGSGISIISGANHALLVPVTFVGAGGTCVFTHNVGRKAFQVIVTDANGNVLNSTDIAVTQTVNAITVTSSSGGQRFISCRWESPTPETDLVAVDDPRVVLTPGT